jgi:metal-dependent amidase/aminoacylase/carboxypeptidase family protein
MVANDVLAQAYTENFTSFGMRLPGKQTVMSGPGGSTDMGDVSYVVPSIHPMFGIPVTPGAGNHTPGFTACAATPEAHEATIRAAKALSMTALDAFCRPELLDAAKAEFRKVVQGK